MKRIGMIAAALLLAGSAYAHFTYVVPDEDGATARVFLSETLEPSGFGAELVAGVKLHVRDAKGHESPLKLDPKGAEFIAALPGSGLRVIHGINDLGVMNRGNAHLLLYYPKSIVGDAFDQRTKVGDSAVVEIVPVREDGDVRLRLLARGEAQANAEVTVVFPDGESKIHKTDAHGLTDALDQKGRYGAWARYWEDTAGNKEGQEYAQVRHYATLVFSTEAAENADAEISAAPFATMPEEASSFGAVVMGDWLYVYGGHIVPTHNYSTEAVSGRFHRMSLKGEQKWEELPGGPGVQGMNLTTDGKYVYRAGGMAPRNKPGDLPDNHSIVDVARFDPEKGAWEALPPMPAGRSSHDAVVVGNHLAVLGGWTMEGNKGQLWAETLLLMDLSAQKLAWKSVKQPFQRRALMAAAHHDKVYLVGGFSETNEILRKVSVFDPKTGDWTEAPELPDLGRSTGFAPAVTVHDGSLYASVGGGQLLRLDESAGKWVEVGKGTPRLAHRLASDGKQLLVLGGAAEGKNFALIEAIAP